MQISIIQTLPMIKFLTKTIFASMKANKLSVTAFQDKTLAARIARGRTTPSSAIFNPISILVNIMISCFLYFFLPIRPEIEKKKMNTIFGCWQCVITHATS